MAYRKLVRRRRLWFAGFLSVPLLLIAVGIHQTMPNWSIPLVAVALLASPVTLAISALALIHTPRTARILRSYPWRAYPCRYPPRGQRRDFFIIVTIAPAQELVLHTSPYRCDLQHRQNQHPDVIWFAGDPVCGGVLSPAGGHYPARAMCAALSDNRPRELPPADALAERAGLAKDGRYLRRWF
ncbi:hypothetical protein [Streptomyces sp.]|uniref:hypothetical protein n=1 Tax=Streptomyces sp. TaxID=1931 RepID=UPI002D794DCF|nr:hypothetical protein [Streptomyces sp.]